MPIFGPMDIAGVLVCDNIRHEIGDKISAMGIFSADLLIPEFPASLTLSFLVHGKALRIDASSIEIKLTSSDPSWSAEIRAVGEIVKMGDVLLPVPQFLIPFPKPGELVVQGREPGGEWQTLLTRKVTLQEPEP